MVHGESPIVQAIVTQVLPKAMFRVQCEATHAQLIANLSAECKRISIKILPGDRVTVQLSPYDPHRGQIMSHMQ